MPRTHSEHPMSYDGPRAKLHFRFATMNAGKSIDLLRVAHNYEERKMQVRVFTSAHDSRCGAGRVGSPRVGLTREAETFDAATDFEATLLDGPAPACVLIDEAQFLTDAQARALHAIAHLRGIPVMAYGLRTDAFGQAFPGSIALLALADALEEIKTICDCGKKATMNIRLNAEGERVTSGPQVQIGAEERYKAVCARRFYTGRC